MATEPLELVLGAKLTDFLQGLSRSAKAVDTLVATVARAKTALVRDLGAIERSLKAMPAATGALAAAASTIKGFAGETKAAAKEADVALRELGATALDTARAVNEGFGGAADAADRAGGRIAGAAGRVRSATGGLEGAGNDARTGLGRAFGAIESGVQGAGKKITSTLTDVKTALAALGGVAVGKEIVDTASEFQDALGQLAIVADDTGVPIDEFRQKLLALAEGTPQDLIGLTNALGTAIGSLPKGADQAAQGFAALDAAQKAARASGATTEEVLKGITSILNTYGKTGITATQISDKLFATFDQGSATVPELTASIGQVAGIASTFGISIDELLGTIAVLTRGGQTASEAITNVRQALISVSRPPEQVKKLLDQLNESAGGTAVEFSAAALKTKGLIGVLEDLEKAGGAGNLEKLLPDTQGFLAASTLLSAGLGQVRDDISRVEQSAGKTDAALEKIKNNFSQTAGIAKNQFKTVLIDIGDRVMPKIQKVLEGIGNFLVANKDAIASGFEKLFDVVMGIGEFVIEHGAQILLFFGGFKIGGMLSDAADAASGFADELNGLAQSAGEAAGEAGELGEDLADEFGESFGGKIAGKIGKALKFASVATEVIAASVAIGTAIGNAIGESLSLTERLKQQLIQANIDEQNRIALERAKAAGYATAEAYAEARKQLDTGEAVRVDDTITPVGEAFQSGRSDALKAAVDATDAQIAELSNKAEQLKAEAAVARQERDLLEKDLAKAAATPAAALEQLKGRDVAADLFGGAASLLKQARPDRDPALAAADARVRNLEADAKAAAEGILKADAQRQAIEAGIEAAKTAATAAAAPAGGKKLKSNAEVAAAKKAQEAAQKAAEDAAKAQNELDAARAAADQRALADQEKKAEQTIVLIERQADAEADYAVKVGGAQSAIVGAWDAAAKQIAAIVEQQTQIVQQAGQAEIDAARAAAAEKTRQYEGSAEAQKTVALALQEEELRIQQATADKVAEIRQKQADRQVEIDQRRLGAVLAGAKAQAARTPAPSLSDTAVNDELTRANRIGSNPAGALGAGIGMAFGGPAGAVAGSELATSIAQLPQTLRSIGDFLRDGLSIFVEDLAGGVESLLSGLLNGLPNQIDKLLGTVIPNLIQRLIGNLPKIIGGFIALLPRVTAAIIANIPAIVGGFIRGLVDAADQIVEAITDGIGDAFADIIDWIKDKLDVSEPVKGFGKALIGDPKASTGERVAAGIATGGLSEGVRFIRSLFHTGGTVRGPGNAGMAAQMAMAGAPHFAFGGMVPRVGVGAQNAIRRALNGDDVPAILQAGEGVLSRAGMAAAGGEAGLAALNRGQTPFGAPVIELAINARAGAERFLAQHAIQSVTASVRNPTGGVRQALDQTRVPSPPLMQRYVKR